MILKNDDYCNKYYVKETLHLQENSVWFSKIDLYRVSGEIQKPIVPQIKIIVPIYKNHIKVGVLVGNFMIKSILKDLSRTTLYNIYLVDKEGEFIWYETENKMLSWSKYLDNQIITLKECFFKEHNQILESDSYKGENFYAKRLNFRSSDEIRMILELKKDSVNQDMESLLKVVFYVLIISFIF